MWTAIEKYVEYSKAVFKVTIPIGGYVNILQYPIRVGFGGGGPRSDSGTRGPASVGGNKKGLLPT